MRPSDHVLADIYSAEWALYLAALAWRRAYRDGEDTAVLWAALDKRGTDRMLRAVRVDKDCPYLGYEGMDRLLAARKGRYS